MKKSPFGQTSTRFFKDHHVRKTPGILKSLFPLSDFVPQYHAFHYNQFITCLIGRFLSWFGSRIFTFGNVSRDTSFIIKQSGLIIKCCKILFRKDLYPMLRLYL